MRIKSEQPGSDGIWTFVFMDMVVFSMLFFVYLSEKIRLPGVFSSGQNELNVFFGLANTLILLTSSWAIFEAVAEARRGNGMQSKRWLSVCLGFGFLFSINKVIEYWSKVNHDITPATNSFFAFYFLITGLHFTHVLGGMGFILHCRANAESETKCPAYLRRLESTGLFWHFVDVLWVFIFPLLYLSAVKP